MPHQCLKCGKVFKQGSSQLLKGCPDCGGNRFFYTRKPLDKEERNAITSEIGQDINSTILDMLGGESEVVDKSGNWLTIKPKEVRKAIEQHLTEKKIKTDKKENITFIPDEESRKRIIEQIELKSKNSDEPETIDIEKSGSYNIDVKGLLEEEPIVIQKDGSYTIHLPSAFKIINKK